MNRELLACGLAADGQLGLRSGCSGSGSINLPTHIIGAPTDSHGSAVVDVACGEKHTLFLAQDGKVWSVGGNEDGQLGRGNKSEGSFSIYPVSFAGGIRVIQVAAGRAHSLAVVEDGRLFAWGNNEHGQLAMSRTVRWQESPRRVSLMEVVQVASGPDHCMALVESGRVFVWGEQYDGANIHEPTEVVKLGGVPIIRVAAGGRHCLALSASGSVFVWGQNEYGQLGLGDTYPRAQATCVDRVTGMKVIDISCGYSHTMLLTNEGRVFAFGSDGFGQLGCGRRLDKQTVPLAVSELMGSTVTRISCGRCHSVVVISGRLYPFGMNNSGQLGNGVYRNQITPRQTPDLDHVAGVFAGWDQTFVMRAGGVPDVAPGPSGMVKSPQVLGRTIVLDLLTRKEKLDLIGLLESTFSSLSSINNAFLYIDDRRFLWNAQPDHGLDMDAVMDTFNALANDTDAKQFAELIIDSCQMSLFSDEPSPGDYCSIECLRAFLVLPWLHSFVLNVKNETVESLHIPFVTAIRRLSPNFRKTLEKWWTFLPRRHFNRVVSAIANGVRCLVAQKKAVSDCVPLLDVLTSLNLINRVTNVIPLESFYISELGESYDLKDDYLQWTIEKGAGRRWANYPFLLNGIAKADLLQVEAIIQQHKTIAEGTMNILGMQLLVEQPYLSITVRRQHLVQDTINALVNNAFDRRSFLKPLRVEFANEEAEDAGGVKKEFFILLFQQILQADYGMFVEDPDSHLVWFSGFDTQEESSFQMLGILCGLAVYNSVLVPFPFPLALYKLLLDQSPSLDDLCELSPIEGRSLLSLLEYDAADFEDVFSLTFTITYSHFGAVVTEQLKQHGEDLAVTQDNKSEYVNLYVKHRLQSGCGGRICAQIANFRQGFRVVVDSRIMTFFQPRELMEMVVGNENYDWTEFREVVKYKGEYHKNHPTILAFWEAFFKLSLDDRKKFMQFLMGSTRLPVKGLSAVDISIQPTAPHCLPVAHTCANLLDLPNIADEKELLRRLLISIEHTEGFTLV